MPLSPEYVPHSAVAPIEGLSISRLARKRAAAHPFY